MVQRRRLILMGMDRWCIPIWIFYRNRLIIFPIIMNPNRIRYHLRRSGTSWILTNQYISQQVFWFCPNISQQFLYQWYNVLWRNCWQHLLYRRLIVRDGTIICKYRFWLHQWRLVLNLRKLILVRVCRHQFLRKRCWRHHHHHR